MTVTKIQNEIRRYWDRRRGRQLSKPMACHAHILYLSCTLAQVIRSLGPHTPQLNNPAAGPSYLHTDPTERGESRVKQSCQVPELDKLVVIEFNQLSARPTYLHADSAERGEEGRRGEQARQVPELDPLTFMLILRRGVRRGGEARRLARSQSLTHLQ